MNNEITFLIGAGAETGSTYGLPSGKYFKSDIIKNDNLSKIFGIFNVDNSALVDKHKILKHNATSTLYQTIKENWNDYNAYSIKLNQNDQNVIKEYLEYKSNNNIDENTSVSSKFKDLYYNNIYKPIIDDTNKEPYSLVDFYLEHLSFCSYVDSYFNFLTINFVIKIAIHLAK